MTNDSFCTKWILQNEENCFSFNELIEQYKSYKSIDHLTVFEYQNLFDELKNCENNLEKMLIRIIHRDYCTFLQLSLKLQGIEDYIYKLHKILIRLDQKMAQIGQKSDHFHRNIQNTLQQKEWLQHQIENDHMHQVYVFSLLDTSHFFVAKFYF